MRHWVRVTVFVVMFPIMLLVVNPLNDVTGAVRDWWENYL